MAKSAKDAKLKAQLIWPGATVFDRGKGHISHQHPTDPNRFMLDTQVGGRGWHFGDGPYTEANEVDTAWVGAHPIDDAPWLKKMVLADYNAFALSGNDEFDSGQLIKYVHPASGEEVTFEPQQLQWTNDLDQIEPIADPQQVSAVVQNEDELLWTDAFGTGIDFRWQAQTARLAKWVDVDSLASLGSPPQYIIDGGNPVLKIGLIFQKSLGVDIYVDGILWDEKSNNPQTTLNNVEFRSGIETLWYFRKPLAFHRDGNLTPSLKLSTKAQSLFVEILVPWAELESATYPVSIDATITPQVGDGDDDAVWGEWYGSTYYDDAGDDLRLGVLSNGGNDDPQHSQSRFAISGPSAQTCDVAYITFVSHFSLGATTVTCNIHAVDENNPSSPNNYAQANADPLTTASVNWQPGSWSGDQSYDSPEIKTVIQELWDSGYGEDGEHIIISIKDAGSTVDAYRLGQSYDLSTSYAPILHIEYSAAATDLSVEPTDEAVTVGDTATITPLLLADVSEQDDVTVVDTPTARLNLDLPSQQDDITVGDTATVDPVLLAGVSELDAVTVGDTATVDPLIIGDVSETEDVTVGDTATVDALLLEVSESDAVTTGETVTVDPVSPTDISELDAVTVGDTPTVVRPLEEDRNVSEQDDITVGDTPTVSLLDAETLSVSEQDDITVGDTPTVSVPEAAALDVSETDPITVGDTATLAPVYSIDIDVSDGVTVTDTPTVQVPVEGEWYVSEGDAVTVGETVTLSPVSPTNVSELDAVTVGDTPTVFRVVEEAYFISESDGVTVVDTPTLGPVTPTEISEIDGITVVDTPTVTFFEPILTLSVGDAVSIVDLSTVRFPSDMLGLDKPEKKPPQYLKDMLDMEPIVRPLSPTFALRQEQKSVIEANRVAEQLARQNEQAAADRVSAMLAREKVDKDKADRRRASSLHNLAKAQLAKEAKAARQDEINKARKKNLQKARRKLKRQRKKK